jgi:hypothetical protein
LAGLLLNLTAVNLMEVPAEFPIGFREVKKDIRRDAPQSATCNRNGGKWVWFLNNH